MSTGDSIRVSLKNGEILTGYVVEVLSEEIVLGKKGNFGHEERTISLSEIVTMELEGAKSPLSLLRDALIITGVVFAISFLGIFGGRGLF